MEADASHIAPLLQLGDERAQLCVGRRRRRARCETRDGVEAVARAVLGELRTGDSALLHGVRRQWEPGLRPAAPTKVDRQPEVVRHDADDCRRLAGDLDLASHYGRISPESSLPQAVAKDHDVRSVGPIFFGREIAAEQRSHAEYGKHIGHDIRDADALRALAVEGHRIVEEEADVGEGRNARLPSLPFVVRQPRLVEALPGAPDDGDALRMSVREGSQEHLLDDAEERRRRPDA